VRLVQWKQIILDTIGKAQFINDYTSSKRRKLIDMANVKEKNQRKGYVKSAIAIIVIVGLVLGFFVGVGLVLNTPTPALVVESSSMSIPYNFMPGPPYPLSYVLLTLEHPFAKTLNVGDLIIIQKVNPKDLNTNYPDSDIIVYENPTDPSSTPIVHRIVASYEINGTLYFQTKGDGNGYKWPAVPPASEYDSNSIYPGNGQGLPQNLVLGKVVLRIPYVGWITLLVKDNPLILPAIIAIIMLLVALEFIIPILRKKKLT
jgi:signal peptidase I